MIVQVPLLLFLLANAAPSDAALYTSEGSSDSLSRAARHVRHVFKRSTGLIGDIRLAYAGIRLQQQPQQLAVQSKLFCTAGTSLTGNGTSPSTGLGGNSGDANGSGNGQADNGSTTTSASSSTPSSVSSPWKISQTWQGNSFFNGWNFISGDDVTTHGTATYVDQAAAQAANLIEINQDGNAIMRVETTPVVSGNRQSIRLESQVVLNGGLIILDAVHMPTGCATWPAFWTFGPNWPANGEIDIVEGVNNYTNNQYTLHTAPGCTLPTSDTNALGVTGSLVDGTDCAAATTANAGCGIRDSRSNSFGAPFNSNGGGVFATAWTAQGVSSWFFPRSSVPSDIENGSPDPTKWGTPAGSFPASTCNPSQFLINHNLVFDTTLCGDWAGAVWGASGVAGQDQSCAAITGVGDCPTYVHQNGAAFSEAYWEVKSVKIYQT